MKPSTANFNLVLNQGNGSTAFQTLYRGYRYFEGKFENETGMIAYMETGSAWVGASDPIVSNPSILGELLQQYARAARADGKKACLLPGSARTAEIARKLGYYAVQVGREPWYEIRESFSGSVTNTKQLIARGAKVEAFDPTRISVGQRSELDDLTDRWLDSRKMASIGFLNRVEPWTLMKHKRYFRAIYHGRQIGFLAAIPVGARNSWYFVDLIRTVDSPVGTTELLISESAKILEANGVTEITLGMSPFAPVNDSEKQINPFAHWMFERTYHKSDALYGFQSLFQFKQKLKPTRWEPQYFISFSGPLNVSVLYGLFKAVFPAGIIHTLFHTASKVTRRNNFERIYAWILSPKIVPKNPPMGWIQYFSKARFSTTLIVINFMAFYASTDLDYQLRPQFTSRYAYSWVNFFSIHPFPRGFLNLIIASFVHWDQYHLIFNILFTLIFMTFVEGVVGGSLLLVTYFCGILFSNPLTSLIIFPLLELFHPVRLQLFLAEKDVGCSLGIFATMGVLFYFIRGTSLWMWGFTIGIIAYTVYSNALLSISHITALLIGLLIARIYEKA